MNRYAASLRGQTDKMGRPRVAASEKRESSLRVRAGPQRWAAVGHEQTVDLIIEIVNNRSSALEPP
jgi:hypothetical protein